jgi:hypothetical protein
VHVSREGHGVATMSDAPPRPLRGSAGVGPHVCDVRCDQQVPRQTEATHARAHGERPHECDVCHAECVWHVSATPVLGTYSEERLIFYAYAYSVILIVRVRFLRCRLACSRECGSADTFSADTLSKHRARPQTKERILRAKMQQRARVLLPRAARARHGATSDRGGIDRTSLLCRVYSSARDTLRAT